MVLIGMPGLEKRLARYPQFYSRVGFVHAFRPLRAVQVRELLQHKWTPSGLALPQAGMTDETTLAAIIRVTGAIFAYSIGFSRKLPVSWRSTRCRR